MACATVQNNPRTRNLNALLGHMLVRLGSVGEASDSTIADTVNAVFLSRTFLKHTIDTSGSSAVVAHLDAGARRPLESVGGMFTWNCSVCCWQASLSAQQPLAFPVRFS